MITVIAFLASGTLCYILGRRHEHRSAVKKQEKASQQLIEASLGIKRMTNETAEELRERARNSIF